MKPAAEKLEIGSPSRSLGWKYGRSPTSRRSWTRSTSSALHDRHRNLVVAATGTGKTVVAALDYRRFCLAGARPRLLFVAHRREILEQSLRTYREVLGDGDFGELYVGGARPERWEHVFASVQSLTSYGVASIPHDAFEIVVIDEFHHAEARTYRRIWITCAPSSYSGSLPLLSGRTAPTFVRSSAGGPRQSFGCGMHWCRSTVPIPLLRGLGWHRPAVDLAGRAAATTRSNSPTSSPATTLALGSF